MNHIENPENTKRLQRAILYSIVAYFLWITWFTPQTYQQPAVDPGSVGQQNTLQNIQPEVEKNSAAEIKTVQQKQVKIDPHSLPLSTADLSMKVDSSNGAIQSVRLVNYSELPVRTTIWGWIFGGSEDDWVPYSEGNDILELLSDDSALIIAGSGEPRLNQPAHVKKGSDGNSIVTTNSSSGVFVTKKYTKTDIPFVLDVEITFNNSTGRSVDNLWVGISEKMTGDGGRFLDDFRPQFHVDDDVETFMDLESIKKKDKSFDMQPAWFGLGSRYFIAAISEQNGSSLKSVKAFDFGDDQYGSISYLSQPLDSGSSRTITFRSYIGPKQLDILQELGDEWADAVEFGIFGFFSRVLLLLLKIFYAGFNNWGVSILLLTLFVRVLFFRMTQKGYESSKKMQMLQPKMAEIKEKYKDNSQLQAQETMKLYREHGASPLGGCLPMLIQMPIWFALYSALLYSVELYDSSFLYLKDLTNPDPYGILPLMYGVLMYASQKFLTPNMENMGEQQQMMMKMMKIMPIMFTFFMFTFPSGLVLYFSCNSILTIAQQWIIRKKMDENPIEIAS